MATTRSEHPWRHAIRALVFLAVLLFMAWGPFSRQILHSGNDLFRPWIMFKGIAVGVVDARYYQMMPNGERREVDRYQVLGYKGPDSAPKHVWRIDRRGNAARLGRQLCKRLGSGVDLRVESRIATRKGWKQEETGQRNLCTSRGMRR